MALKVRNFEELVRSAGFERALTMTVRELIEQHHQLEQNQLDIGMQLNQMTDLLQNFVQVAGNMKQAHQEMLKRLPPDDSIEIPGEITKQ